MLGSGFGFKCHALPAVPRLIILRSWLDPPRCSQILVLDYCEIGSDWVSWGRALRAQRSYGIFKLGFYRFTIRKIGAVGGSVESVVVCDTFFVRGQTKGERFTTVCTIVTWGFIKKNNGQWPRRPLFFSVNDNIHYILGLAFLFFEFWTTKKKTSTVHYFSFCIIQYISRLSDCSSTS